MNKSRYQIMLGQPVMNGAGLLDALKRMGVRVNTLGETALKVGSKITLSQIVDLVPVEVLSLLPDYPEGSHVHEVGVKNENFAAVIARAQELGFNLCAPECAPRFMLQHGADLESGECFSLLMDGVQLLGYKVIFSFGKDADGQLFLNGEFRSFFFPTNLPVLAVSN